MLRRSHIQHLQRDLKAGEQKVLQMQEKVIAELDEIARSGEANPKRIAELKEEIADIRIMLEHVHHEQQVEYVTVRRIPLKIKFAFVGVCFVALSGGGSSFYWTQLRQNVSYGEEGGSVERFIPFTRSAVLNDKLYFSGESVGSEQFEVHPIDAKSIVGLFPLDSTTLQLFYIDQSETRRLLHRTLTQGSLQPIGEDTIILEDEKIVNISMEQDATSGNLYTFVQFENALSRLIVFNPQGEQQLYSTEWQQPSGLDWSNAFIGVTNDRVFIGANTLLPEHPTLLDVQHVVLFPFSLAGEPQDGRYEIDSQSYHLKTPCVMQNHTNERYVLACGGRENVPSKDYIKGDELFAFLLDTHELQPQEIIQLTYNKGHDFALIDAQLTSRKLLFTSQNFTNTYPQTPTENFGYSEGTGNITLRIFAPQTFALGATYNATDYPADQTAPVRGATDSYIYVHEQTNVLTEAHQFTEHDRAYIVVTANQLIPNGNALQNMERSLEAQ